MNSYKLTITFDDGEVVTETFKTPLGMHRAIKWWKDAVAADDNQGANSYKIVSLDGVEL